LTWVTRANVLGRLLVHSRPPEKARQGEICLLAAKVTTDGNIMIFPQEVKAEEFVERDDDPRFVPGDDRKEQEAVVVGVPMRASGEARRQKCTLGEKIHEEAAVVVDNISGANAIVKIG
jgi:hypothetical protein